jgi:hypothetical protein
MPTYKKGEVTITKPPQDFIDRVAREEAEALAEARVAQDEVIVADKISKMQFNLKSDEYREMFAQWERLKQESSQRLQRIEQQQLSLSQQHKQRNQQLQSQMRMQQRTTESSRNINNNNTDNTESSNVLKHLKLMKRITGT